MHSEPADAQDALSRKKLELDCAEQRYWPFKMVVPMLTIALTALALIVNSCQTKQRDLELKFAQAIGGVSAPTAMQRLAAVTELESLSLTNEESGSRAALVLITTLDTEQDPAVQEAVFNAVMRLGRRAVPELVMSNKRAQVRLARALGRIVGLDLRKVLTSGPPENGMPENEKKVSEIEFNTIGETVARIAYSRWPLEEVKRPNFIRGGFWLQFFPDTNRQTFDNEKFDAWTYPPDDLDHSRRAAMDEVVASVRFLAITSFVLEELVKSNSGKIYGWNLQRVYFVVPDFRHSDLRGIDLSYAQLPMADFRFADLSGANCTGANLDSANFAHGKFERINFRGANLDMVRPVPVDSPQGYVHSYIGTPSGGGEFQRLEGANFAGSSWRNAAAISPGLKAFLSEHSFSK